jgi:hypothetical protein
MKMIQKTALVSFLVFAPFCVSFGQEVEKKASPFRFLIKGGLDFGGDEVAEVYFEDGSTQSVPAGQGGSIGIGAEFQVPAIEKLKFHATVGYKYVTTKADNAHIRLSRVPMTVTTNWMVTNKLRIGAGVTSHQAIRFKGDEILNDMTLTAGPAPTFEIAYGVLGATYTPMNYKDEANAKYSANAIGVSLTFTIPKR